MRKLLIILFLFMINPVLAATVDEMAGQMIMTDFVGNTVKSKGFKTVLKQVENGEITGVIFFSDNIKNKEEFLKMTSALKNSKAKHKPFIAIDMEGGIIQRMNSTNGFIDFKSAEEVSKMTEEAAYYEYSKMAKMLKKANINLNFAPCVDLATNPESIIVRKQRSYSTDPKIVVKYAKQFIQAHYDNKIITSLKHFPGHGSPTGDTHLGYVDATNTFSENEIIPYLELANLNPMQTVMISHIFNKNLDEKLPASLSYDTIEKFLRIQAGYNGVIVTDDLAMGAISRNYELDDIVALAINAGENILLFCNRTKVPDKNFVNKVHFEIKQGLIDERISPENILNSYNKIMELKKTLD